MSERKKKILPFILPETAARPRPEGAAPARMIHALTEVLPLIDRLKGLSTEGKQVSDRRRMTMYSWLHRACRNHGMHFNEFLLMLLREHRDWRTLTDLKLAKTIQRSFARRKADARRSTQQF